MEDPELVTSICYRPFDTRAIYYDHSILARSRFGFMKNLAVSFCCVGLCKNLSRFEGVEGAECVQADGEVIQRCEGPRPVMLANAAVVFAVGGVSGQVQFVLDAPLSAVECEQAVLIGLVDRKAGDAADGFLGGLRFKRERARHAIAGFEHIVTLSNIRKLKFRSSTQRYPRFDGYF